MPLRKRPFRFACIATAYTLALSMPAAAQQWPGIELPRAQRLAAEDRLNHPPADIEGLWRVILEFRLKRASYVFDRGTWFVTVTDKDGHPMDLPQSMIASIKRSHVRILPGSFLTLMKLDPGHDEQQTIDRPLYRPDGNYDVFYSYYCGGTCGGSMILVMHHDANGWSVVATLDEVVA